MLSNRTISRLKTRTGFVAMAAICALSLLPAAAQAKSKCRLAGSHTVVQNGYARVYTKGAQAFVCVKASGSRTPLAGATPADQFALGGRYVGWSSSSDPNADPGTQIPPHSVVTVMHIPDRHVDDYRYPFETNETVDRIVVAADGAAAWAITPPPGDDSAYTIVQGTDRQSHPEDQFSDDHADTIGTSLRIHGLTVTWSYVDGSTGSQKLY